MKAEQPEVEDPSFCHWWECCRGGLCEPCEDPGWERTMCTGEFVCGERRVKGELGPPQETVGVPRRGDARGER